jgi:uncharacterized protein YgiM (DUF1202 family)
MKTLLATTLVLAGLVVSAAGSANAASAYQCQVYAQNAAEQQYPTGGGAVGGGIAGGIIGGLVAGATGGKVGNGVALGAGAGLVVGSVAWQNAKKQAYDNAYAGCLDSNAQPVSAPPPQVYSPPPPTSGPFNGVISGASSVNVRNGPGTNYAVIGQMYAQQSVSVASCGGGWCQIYLSNGVGFVAQNYIYPIPG